MELGQLYNGISVGCFIAGGLAFAFAVFLFFRYRIIDVFNELSGRTLKKNMERLSALSGSSTDNKDEAAGRHAARRQESTAGTDTLTDSGSSVVKRSAAAKHYRMPESPRKYDEQDRQSTDVLFDTSRRAAGNVPAYDRTEEIDIVLSDADSTELLDAVTEDGTAVLGRGVSPDETELL